MGFEGIGASVRRKEDQRFLNGRGNYTDDINRPGQLHACIKRSDRPHARIISIDTAAAKAAPGVAAVFTGADIEADALGGIPCGWQIHNKDGTPMAEPMHPVIASGKVRHVGDPIAVVIADTRQHAKDAAELLVIELEDLPAVAEVRDAVAPGAALVHDDAPGNICYDWHIGDKAIVDAAFAVATRTVSLDLTNNRLIPNAMEPRAAIGDYDVNSGDFTLYTTSQNPHVIAC
jgi:carbon-monoxide dehydrogenase large subunit